jgi:hypothetical protein
VSYFKIFESRCYIHKDERNGKFDSKCDECIFLGYSSKRKAYKCFNRDTNTMIESANVRIDEFVDKNDEERKKEPDDYNMFIYVYEYFLGIMNKQQ